MSRRAMVLAVAIAIMVAALPTAAPAASSASPCAKPKWPLTHLQEEIAYARRFRRGSGLRTDRAWIVRVLRSRRAVARYRYGTALLPSEVRYMRRVERVGDAAERVRAYVRGQGPGLSGGVSVQPAYPRAPYVLVRLTRERARYEPLIRARFPSVDLRFADAALPEPAERFRDIDVQAVRRRVEEDGDRLEREGVWVQLIDLNEYDHRVDVEVITRRTDAQAFFEARYAPAIAVKVIARERSRLECTEALGYRPGPTGRSLVVQWVTNSVYDLRRIEVRETARSVRIGIVHWAPNGLVTQAGLSGERRVRLRRPLGGRRVVDAATGQTLYPLTQGDGG